MKPMRAERLLTAKSLYIFVMLAASSAFGDSKVTVGSPQTDFPRNSQNEPAVAVDPTNPLILAAGGNDLIDQAPCDGSPCVPAPGIGGSGIYFSFDGGVSWTQPQYTGLSAGNGTPTVGPIGTLPNYYENGLQTRGDPALAFGPRPGPNGFSWANGSRLYFGNLTTNLTGETIFPGTSAIAISYADDLHAAAAGDATAWSNPVIVSRQNPPVASDKDAVWADNSSSSPYFGNCYVCYTGVRSVDDNVNFPQPIVISRSTDGGNTWEPRQISPANNTTQGPRGLGRQACAIRTDSDGVVYVVWIGFADFRAVQYLARSFNGGLSYEPARPITSIVPCGASDPVSGLVTFDGVAGSRTNSFPSLDVANGAPTGGGQASNVLVLSWCDAAAGLNNETALVQISTDKGKTWSQPVNAAAEGDRPAFPAVAVSQNGSDIYVTYDAFLQPWQRDTSNPRLMQGVVRHADISNLGAWSELHRGVAGDARGSHRIPEREFVYDYNYTVATADGAVALWMDARNAADCPAMDAYRESLLTSTPLPEPAIATDCPATFGNLDIYAVRVLKP
jgi:hypothetical protein